MEYEDILLGKRKDFSTAYLGKENSEKEALDIIRYAFEKLLGWSPVMIRDYCTPELIQLLHLQRPVNKIEFPPELDRNQDLFYIAWLLYPHTIHHSKRDLTLRVYQKVLDGRLVKFPKNFFLTASGEINASICMRYAINQFLNVSGTKNLYMFFADISKAREFLKEVRLLVPCTDIYEYPIDMLHNCLSKSQQNDLFYRYGRFLTEMNLTKEKLYENHDK